MASQSPMYRAFVEVVPEASGFTGALTGQVAASSATAGAVGGKAAGGGFVAGFGKMLPVIGGVIAAFSVGDAIADSIANGSQLEQARGAIDQVYGSLGATAITAFAEGGAKSVGQSMNDILGSASLLGTFGKAAGLADDDLVDFSETLITLGADLSAFAGTTPEQAVQALSAGLRGESEPLRQYGVLLDDAALKARAMEMGIYDGNGPLTQQQRILAAYNEILAQTTDQQGQYGREQDTLAGKQAHLAAAFDNISARVGEAFLPVLTELADLFIEHAVPALEEFAAWLNDPATQEYIGKWATGLQQISEFLGVMSEKFATGAEQIGSFFGVVGEKFAIGWQQISDFFGAVGGAFATGMDQIGAWAGSIGNAIGAVLGWFGELPGRIGSALSGAASWLFSAGQDIISGLINGISSMFSGIIGAITDTVDGAIGWAKDLLGIHSPSTVFAEIGENTARGFANGIESRYSEVRASTKGLTGTAIAGVGDGQSYGAGNVVALSAEDRRLIKSLETLVTIGDATVAGAANRGNANTAWLRG